MKRIESLLVATDFSHEARSAVSRAAILAKELHGPRAVLVHVLDPSAPPEFEAQVRTQAQRALGDLVEEIRKGEGLELEPRLLSGNVVDRLAQTAGEFDVVLVGARGEHLLLDFALGRTSERLIRRSRRPVLVVKRRPRAPYRRVLVAVDFSPHCAAALACIAALAPKAELHLVHAFEVEFESTLRFTGVPDDEVYAYRQRAREQAAAAMERLISELALPEERVSRLVAHGYPPKVVLNSAESLDAQLVVVGKQRQGLEELLLGSVAVQVLEKARCDVLVVPTP
jgi:nucleotide-binding universal stress UspA family protein